MGVWFAVYCGGLLALGVFFVIQSLGDSSPIFI
jgi:hypothetical protein